MDDGEAKRLFERYMVTAMTDGCAADESTTALAGGESSSSVKRGNVI